MDTRSPHHHHHCGTFSTPEDTATATTTYSIATTVPTTTTTPTTPTFGHAACRGRGPASGARQPDSGATTPMASRSEHAPSPKKPGADATLTEAVQQEHALTFWEAARLYPKAVGWSVYVSIGVIMLAFDPQIVGNMFAMPQFQKDFGFEFEGEYIISAAWQTGLSLGNPVGQVVGALFSAYPMEVFGRKRTFFGCVALTAGLVFIQFFARSLQALLVGELLGGLVLGCFVVIGPTYASEVCPMALRGYLTSYTNLCFVTGQLLANGVTAGTASIASHWAYSVPFALQWFWVAVIVPGIFFIPESPWWLVRKGRTQDARDALCRLSSPAVDVDAALAVIAETDRLELEMEAGSTYLDTVRGANLRRTEISTGVYTTQVLSGIYLIGYGTYFFQQAGLQTQDAFYMGIGFLAVGWVCTVLSWFLLARFGRRRIFNVGLSVLIALMFVIGILDSIPGRPPGVAWAESSLMLVWNGVYDLSVGPITFVILGECSATRVRSKTIAVATAAQAVVGIGMTVAIPYMINPSEANMQGKLGYFFGGLGVLCLVWGYFRIPETQGKTYEELDLLFDRNVPARQFKNYRDDSVAILTEG
ncbi:sugar porter family MFS transporter [Durotheca rogersii]|uniref:sugar porter family MFS transporter n=1 Tax=Durotheca rogersii TaxID=419775 RepID=UPI00221FC490|nr:sugar porter family MFS transporter [Durotheca rogersii]KAI5864361.1 sugar porter family MFS transporter [Durotheca rogersii]